MQKINELYIDYETRSKVDLPRVGVYKYVEDEDFKVLLAAISINHEEVVIYDLTKENLPKEIIDAIKDNKVKKYSFNAQFERIVSSKLLGMKSGEYLDPDSWYCDMVHALYLGLPSSLDKVGMVLEVENRKMIEGKKLINYFSKTMEPTEKNGYKTWNEPDDSPYEYSLFKEYCKRDVVTELEIHDRLEKFPVPEIEWQNYHLDQRINDRGVLLDMELVEAAIEIDKEQSETNEIKAKELTGLDNPNSVKQLKDWLIEQGTVTETLSKTDVERLLRDATGNIEEILRLRQEMSKSSVKKYETMRACVCKDGRARGLIQFYGANRTGRFAGRLIQVQNLPQNHLEDLDYAREIVKKKDTKEIIEKYQNIPDTLSQLIRTALIPGENKKFIVCDYSAIEARVIAWYAKEIWRQDAFKENKDIYCESASRMFHKNVVKNGENAELRKYGKICELALGFGAGINGLRQMGGGALGLPDRELASFVDKWRAASPKIVKFWWDMDRAVNYVILNKTKYILYGLELAYERGIFFIKLPSGRRLAYCKPRLGINGFGKEVITYEGIGTNKHWERIESYGPKIVENIVQATARDIICEAIRKLEKKGYQVVFHVHDEVIIETEDGKALEDIKKIMNETPMNMEGIILNSEGYICEYYKKD